MTRLFSKFCSDESGAVTVDWVVITAAVVGMSAISFWSIEDNASTLMNSAGSAVGAQDDFGTDE